VLADVLTDKCRVESVGEFLIADVRTRFTFFVCYVVFVLSYRIEFWSQDVVSSAPLYHQQKAKN